MKNLKNLSIKNLRLKSAGAFLFLFFLLGTSIRNGQQGISYNVMQLTEGRDFNHKTTMKARNLNIPQNYLKSSKTLLLVRCCYVSGFILIF